MVMAHTAANVAVVEGGADSLGSLISWVDDAGDVGHGDQVTCAPFLQSKVLDIAVPSTFQGDLFVDDV